MEHDRATDVALPRGVDEILARAEGDIRAPTHSVPRASLDREERIIKETLLRMASLIEERIRLTVEALETHDAALALTVIEGDAEINAMQAEALDHIIRTIATQAPVARDLPPNDPCSTKEVFARARTPVWRPFRRLYQEHAWR